MGAQMSSNARETERVEARYWIETAYPLAHAAEVMAGEQSSGTFVSVPGETEELKAKHAARVEAIRELESVAAPSLPGAGVPKSASSYHRAEVTLSWPLSNMGLSLPNLMATVAGNLFELKPFSGLRLLDVKFCGSFLDRYQGPQFGVNTRSSARPGLVFPKQTEAVAMPTDQRVGFDDSEGTPPVEETGQSS